MGWKKTGTNEPVIAPKAEEIRKEVQKQPERTGWGVMDYPGTQPVSKIRNADTGQEYDMLEALAELLNRTEE